MTRDKKLYEYELDHGYIVKDENGNINNSYHRLIASNVTGMTMYDVSNLNNPDETCGGYYVVYKLKSGILLYE